MFWPLMIKLGPRLTFYSAPDSQRVSPDLPSAVQENRANECPPDHSSTTRPPPSLGPKSCIWEPPGSRRRPDLDLPKGGTLEDGQTKPVTPRKRMDRLSPLFQKALTCLAFSSSILRLPASLTTGLQANQRERRPSPSCPLNRGPTRHPHGRWSTQTCTTPSLLWTEDPGWGGEPLSGVPGVRGNSMVLPSSRAGSKLPGCEFQLCDFGQIA